MPWKPSHISPQVCNTGATLREVEMSLGLLAGTWDSVSSGVRLFPNTNQWPKLLTLQRSLKSRDR